MLWKAHQIISYSIWTAITILEWVACTTVLFLTALETGKSKFKVLADSSLVSTHSWLIDGALSVFSHSKRGRQFSGVPFMRTLIPLVRTEAPQPNYFPGVPPSNAVTLVNEFQHMDFWRERIQR